MLVKDKIFLVVYIDTKNICADDEYEYINGVERAMSHLNDGSVELLLIPNKEGRGTRVECINPVLLNEKEYERVRNLTKKFKKEVGKFVSEQKKKEDGK